MWIDEPLKCTPEEYLARERAAENRSEYIDGWLRPMPRNNRWHNLIMGSIVVHLRGACRNGPCWAFGSGIRVKVQATGLYTYPDVLVCCDHPQVEDEHDETILNPGVIVEILSQQTEAYDRGKKFSHYRRLDALREYILVDQAHPRIESYVRDGTQWWLMEVSGLESSLMIETLGHAIPLAEIYERVEFPDDVENRPS